MSVAYSGSIKYFKAFLQILQIWASENVGSDIEVDFDKLWEYVSSEKGVVRKLINTDRDNSEDALFELVEQDIIEGCPVWEFLVLSDWTKRMLEIEFSHTVAQANIEYADYMKQFVCPNCSDLVITETPFGTIYRCNSKERRLKMPHSERVFELKKTCKFYKEKT